MSTVYHMDGYEDYVTALIARYHTSTNGSPAIVTGGRNGGKRLDLTGYAAQVRGPLSSDPDVSSSFSDVTAAFAATFSSIAAGVIFEFRSANNSIVKLRLNADGSLTALRHSGAYDIALYLYSGGNVTDLVTTNAGLIEAGTLVHIGFRVIFHATAGEVYIDVNGVEVIHETGLNTTNASAEALATSYCMGQYSDKTPFYADDFYVASAFLGDRRVDSHFMTSDGANTDGTPSSGSDHFAMVDEASPDDDTSTITLDAAGERESYDHDDFKNTGASIDAVMVVVDAKKADAGTATVGTVVRQSSTNYDGTSQGLSTAYAPKFGVYNTDPATSAAWTESGFNAVEFGYKKVA